MSVERISRRGFFATVAVGLGLAELPNPVSSVQDRISVDELPVGNCFLMREAARYALIDPVDEKEKQYVEGQTYEGDKTIFLNSVGDFLYQPLPQEFSDLVTNSQIDESHPYGNGFYSSYQSYVSLYEAGCAEFDLDPRKDTVVGNYTIVFPESVFPDLVLNRYVNAATGKLVSQHLKGFLNHEGILSRGRIRKEIEPLPAEVLREVGRGSFPVLHWNNDLDRRERIGAGVGMLDDRREMDVTIDPMLAFSARINYL